MLQKENSLKKIEHQILTIFFDEIYNHKSYSFDAVNSFSRNQLKIVLARRNVQYHKVNTLRALRKIVLDSNKNAVPQELIYPIRVTRSKKYLSSSATIISPIDPSCTTPNVQPSTTHIITDESIHNSDPSASILSITPQSSINTTPLPESISPSVPTTASSSIPSEEDDSQEDESISDDYMFQQTYTEEEKNLFSKEQLLNILIARQINAKEIPFFKHCLLARLDEALKDEKDK